MDAVIVKSAVRRISAASLLETSMILQSRRKDEGVRDLDYLIMLLKIEVVPFNESQARLARDAFKSYGKGRHAAGLNFGDCMSYALARETGEELLFKGTDFSATDVRVASY